MSTAKFRTPPQRPTPSTAAPPLSHTEDEMPPLEIAFSFNTAGAYGPMLPSSKCYLRHLIHCLDSELLRKIFTLSPASPTRLAILAHGLHDKAKGPRHDLKYVDLTDDVMKLTRFADSASPLTWGSTSHCYELALRKARSLSWRPGSRRALVLVGCTRPHYGYHPGSDELIHWRVEARCLAQMGVAVYTVEVKVQNIEHEFYRSVAEITEGCHVTLEQFTEMTDVITAIASHIEFEQEVIESKADHYTTDMARLFATLRQHEDTMTSLPGTRSPATPQGSDFGDDVSDPGDVNGDDVGAWPEAEESPGLKRRFSLRLRLNSMAVNRTDQSMAATANKNYEPSFFKLKRRPGVSSSSSSSLARLPRRGGNEAAGSKPLSLTNRQTVSFYLPDGDDEEEGAQKVMTSSPLADPVSSRARSSMKKSKTVALPAARGEKERNRGDCGVVENSMDDALTALTTEEGGSNPRKRPALRKGVTNVGLRAGEGGGAVDNYGGEFLLGGSCSAKVYKIEREAPEKREHILPRAFTLRHLSWSPWKLVISPCCPAKAEDQWEPRLQNGHGGYRRKKVFTEGEDIVVPALYEIAVTPDNSTKKRVVFYTTLQTLGDPDASSWESQILARDEVRQEVSEAIRKKCSVFLRRAPLAQNTSRAQRVIQTALHKYDYAWNGVQGFKRPIRRVDFF